MSGDHLAVETVGLVKNFPAQPGWGNLLRKGGEKVALDGVSLSVPAGETFGLLGPNGAGKTTMVKILSTLISPTTGVARVAGYDVMRHAPQVRRSIGLVYGDARSFFWRLSLVENLRFFSALSEIPAEIARRRIPELIELVGLADAAHVRMHSFSSGMKQRAAIARGLLSDPAIVFLDEPTASVDPVGAAEIRRMIRERVARDGGRTVILTTNIMPEAEALCDRVALLNCGRIELAGDIASLRKRFQPDERYVLTISGVGEGVLRDLRAVPGIHELEVSCNGTQKLDVALVVGPETHAIPEAIRRVVAASGCVWACRKQELSLEEMFHLTFGGK